MFKSCHQNAKLFQIQEDQKLLPTKTIKHLYQKDPRMMAGEITAKIKENYGVNLSISTIK
jgi:hypothetical protein